jgi:hypothetical protein
MRAGGCLLHPGKWVYLEWSPGRQARGCRGLGGFQGLGPAREQVGVVTTWVQRLKEDIRMVPGLG